jgi:hypothetical protein
MAGVVLDPGLRRMLLADWFICLARESDLDFGQRSSGAERYTFGEQKAFHVIADFCDEPPFLKFVAIDASRQGVIDQVAAKASEHLDSGDFGGFVWYSTALSEVKHSFSPFLMGPLLQRLGSQTRIAGWRRLGSSIVLEFVEEIPEGWAQQNQIFAPKAVVHVHIAAPGPCAGDFSSHIAHGGVETVGAICTFALGRPVQLPHGIFPANDDQVPQLDRRRQDPEILTLARKGVSLDIFSGLAASGGFESFSHARSALITFDAAMRQERDSVAAIL